MNSMEKWVKVGDVQPVNTKSLYWVARPLSTDQLCRLNDYSEVGGQGVFWQSLDGTDFDMEGTSYIEVSRPAPWMGDLTPAVQALNVTDAELAELDGNISLGSPLQTRDIVQVSNPGIYIIGEDNSGSVKCYCCREEKGLSTNSLEPLTSSTGVFTSVFECNQGAPVWVCFSCMPWRGKQFDWLVEPVQAVLLEKVARKQAIENAMSVYEFTFDIDGDKFTDSLYGVSEQHAYIRLKQKQPRAENCKVVRKYDPK